MTDKVTLKWSLGRFRGAMGALAVLKRTKLSAALGYAINKTITQFVDLLKPCEAAVKDIGRKYDAKFEQNGSFQVPKKNLAAFNIEASDFMETEEELEVRTFILPPECELENAGEVLVLLEDFVSVRGMDAPEPRKPNPPGADGKPMSDQETAQRAVDETAKPELKVVE